MANRWLRHAESDLQLTGCGPGDSRVGPALDVDAVLCRGNADAMQEVLAFLEQGVPVALTGGGDQLRRTAQAAQDLKSGRRTTMELAEQPFAPLRALPPEARICGPTFQGSHDIGGADADFILGGLLLDCKATIQPRRLGREEIYQLAGYLLLDYDDRYGINRVGLYLSRQGALIVWTVQDFLHRLGATRPVTDLRRRLRAHLAHLAGLAAPARGPQPSQGAGEIAREMLGQCDGGD